MLERHQTPRPNPIPLVPNPQPQRKQLTLKDIASIVDVPCLNCSEQNTCDPRFCMKLEKMLMLND